MKYILRETPEFSIELQELSFTLKDDKRKMHSGVFAYSDIVYVSFKTERTNILMTLFSVVFSLFTDTWFGDIVKDKTVFTLKLKNKIIRTHAKDFDTFITNQIVNALEEKHLSSKVS